MQSRCVYGLAGRKPAKASRLRKWDSADRQLFGDFLPIEYSCYKRAKAGLPARYRLFFRFSSKDKKNVIIWLNDEHTLRKDGSKTDVYYIFNKMLDTGIVPSNWKNLLDQAQAPKTKRASKN